ncbi:MAG: VWA domain-containing protein [Chloroflexi bacterium]|nr:VWA domain-containing protein [Chloroflexota bacterium]
MLIRYTRWDGTQHVLPPDADDLMDALSDDLVDDGDLWRALQRLLQQGFQDREGRRLPGLQDLLERLRRRRQEQLERYNLSGIVKDLQDKLEQVKQTERAGIQRRLDEGRQKARTGEVPEGLQKTLERMAAEKQRFLDQLPGDLGGQIKQLSDYDFMDPEARRLFQELLQVLQQQLLQSHFQGLQQAIQGLTSQDLQRLREMIRDLNQMLRDRAQGREPDFDEFMRKHGQFFPGVENLDQLLEQLQRQMVQMQALLESMSPEQRRQLQQMLDAALRDDRLRGELAMLAANLAELLPRPGRQRYPFQGDEPVTLQEAMQLMGDLQEIDRLEQQLRGAQDEADLAQLDANQLARLLGDDAAEQLEQLRQVTRQLEEAGYLERRGNTLELTARAIRRIGHKALQDIFLQLKRDRFGQHAADFRGQGVDRTDESKSYEFGDPFLLDLRGTLFNALEREAAEQRATPHPDSLPGGEGTISLSPWERVRVRGEGTISLSPWERVRVRGEGTSVRLKPQDFEVYKTELLTSSATVLMLDMSRSMILRGCFLAAKKVAMALNALIKGQFPRDRLHVIGFSYYAKELQADALPTLTWNEWVYGTNMQHGFMLARQLLSRARSANKQIIVITDGEPTAHFEGGRVEFSYPPTHRTYQETLKEVQRCTRDRILINTFMLERSYSLMSFVEQMTRLNHGRAFYTTPDRLGEYILVDFVRNKRRMVS